MRAILLWLLLGLCGWAQPVLRVRGEAVEIDFPGDFQVLRSTGGPTSQWSVRGGHYRDELLAHGLDYTYEIRGAGGSYRAGPVRLPARALARSARPWLRVDKSRYLLSVMDGERVLKSYGLAMGRQPMTRKLRFDNASTPEGRYQLVGLQAEATYYKALDLNYPNETDRARHAILDPGSDIGGEIQIHGMGISHNWTWGCMAMRNEDIDELFAHREIGVGTVIWIYGGEVTLAQLRADARAGPVDRLALGRRQKRRGLPVTCLVF